MEGTSSGSGHRRIIYPTAIYTSGLPLMSDYAGYQTPPASASNERRFSLISSASSWEQCLSATSSTVFSPAQPSSPISQQAMSAEDLGCNISLDSSLQLYDHGSGFNDRLLRTTQTYVVDQCSDPIVQDQVEWDFVDQPSKTVCADQGLLLSAGPANWQNPFHGQVQTQAIDKSFRSVASSFQTPTLWSMPQEFHAPSVTNSSMETLYSNVLADHQSAASYSWSTQPTPGFVTPLDESTSSFIVPSHKLVESDTTSPIRIHQDSFDGSFESLGDQSIDYSSDGTSVSEEHYAEIKHESDYAIVKQDPDFGEVTRPAGKIHTSRTGAKSIKKERRQPRSGRKKPKLGRSYISQKDGRTTVIEEYSAGRASNPERCSYVNPVTHVRCGSEFQRVEHLRRHEKIHFPEDKPFPCPLRECIDRKTGDHRRFPRTDNRFDHYKTHLREQGKGQRNTRVDFEIFCDLVRQAEEPDLADKTIERLRQWRSKERMKHARENGRMGFLRPKL